MLKVFHFCTVFVRLYSRRYEALRSHADSNFVFEADLQLRSLERLIRLVTDTFLMYSEYEYRYF